MSSHILRREDVVNRQHGSIGKLRTPGTRGGKKEAWNDLSLRTAVSG